MHMNDPTNLQETAGTDFIMLDGMVYALQCSAAQSALNSLFA